MSSPESFFFIHLHKTGGLSFRKMLGRRFRQEVTYPNASDASRRYPDFTPAICDLMALPEARRASIRLLCGHFPFVAGERLVPPVRRLVFLRHPVARTVSHLKHAKRFVPRFHNWSLAALFDLPRERRLLLHNPQTRTFAFDSLEEACRDDGSLRMDRARLERAKENLATCEFVGITEAYADSIALCERIFGWRLGPIPHENKNPLEEEPDDRLRERVLDAVRWDLEFYAFACERHEALKARHPPKPPQRWRFFR